jgi:protein gp37
MSADWTTIEWTDATWNPTRGCSRISPGCKNCYAERIAARFSGAGLPYEGLARITPSGARWSGELRVIEDDLDQPLHWKKPRRIFVNSMSDLFHEAIDDEEIDAIFSVMALAEHHTFQVLTKRSERMFGYFERRTSIRYHGTVGSTAIDVDRALPLPNVWLGVSVEDSERRTRIKHLRGVPAAVRFLSMEPLLEHPGKLNLDGIAWVIAGGESGPGARPMHPSWARAIRDQCMAARVPFFFKQWGAWLPLCDYYHDEGDGKEPYDFLQPWLDRGRELIALQEDGDIPQSEKGKRFHHDHQPAPGSWWMGRTSKKEAGRELDGREWNEFPRSAS